LEWSGFQKANKGLFDYTLIQQGKDLGLSQFDQFKRSVLGFEEDAKNVPRDVANSHGSCRPTFSRAMRTRKSTPMVADRRRRAGRQGPPLQ
jgi:CRP-like cAMP-binding protein